ncbi:MAG TPA: AarF/UbiB family protein [Candidatus Kapabacteria bacterium]|nr:AarF/UbiB family protein [Candidatus Kapabacteria bacterium]
MKISLKPQHLKFYQQIATLLFKYGRSDLVQDFATTELLDEKEVAREAGTATPEQLANDLEAMGPTFVKLGQILSSRPDLLPEPYLKALSRLQDKVKPFPFEEVEQTIVTELGVRLSRAFADFQREPVAAASLGQVHRATLRDGRAVVVKVQRPGIRPQIIDELQVLDEIAAMLEHTKSGKRYQVQKIFDEFRKSLVNELDYQKEAANMAQLGENLREFPNIRVPQPITGYTSRSVLTMEFISGRKITEITPLARLDINGEALAEELFRAYLKQVLVDGLFHADPHPGNVFLTDDRKVALLDLGMVGRTTVQLQEQIVKMLMAISEGKSEVACDIAVQISQPTDEFDEKEFRRQTSALIVEQKDNRLREMDVGKAVLAMTRIAGENGLYVPTELTLLGKTLLQLDEIGKTLDPDFDPNGAIRRNVTTLLHQRMWKSLSPTNIAASFLDIKDFVGTLPGRLSRILDSVANAELEVKIKAVDVSLLMAAFHKIANRITSGLILAALIIGASLLMQVKTEFTIFGYPGLAMIFFMAAAAGGFHLLISIYLHDHRDEKKSKL